LEVIAMTAQPNQTPTGPYDVVPVDGRPAYFARGVPVLEPDALVLPVPAQPSDGEFGAQSFARDIARWMQRIFDWPVESVTYRENRWDHRPCPRAQSYEIVIVESGVRHVVLVTAYDQLSPERTRTCTVHAISLDGRPVAFESLPSTRHLAWRLAWAAWRATTTAPAPGRVSTGAGAAAGRRLRVAGSGFRPRLSVRPALSGAEGDVSADVVCLDEVGDLGAAGHHVRRRPRSGCVNLIWPHLLP
jgi:hypothetical protein